VRVWLINDRPDHAVLVEAVALLRLAHDVVPVDPSDGAALAAATARLAGPGGHRGHDLVLLKSHDPAAIVLGRRAVASGARVVNDPEATAASLDRVRMARLATGAGLPFPVTTSAASLECLVAQSLPLGALVVKSRLSRRGDLVARVDGAPGLAALAAQWPAEPVVVQPLLAGDGWDHKVWVVGEELFYGRRRSPLDGAVAAREGGATLALGAADLPPGWERLARDVGTAFGLRVFGLDLLATPSGPVVVDVNPFPGCRGVAGAARAIAALVDSLAPEPVR
jgi:ribosomal protein S6--L-glutamate ligase